MKATVRGFQFFYFLAWVFTCHAVDEHSDYVEDEWDEEEEEVETTPSDHEQVADERVQPVVEEEVQNEIAGDFEYASVFHSSASRADRWLPRQPPRQQLQHTKRPHSRP